MPKASIPEQALHIQRTLGTYRAARFLAKRGFTVSAAKTIFGLPIRAWDLLGADPGTRGTIVLPGRHAARG